MFAPPLPIIEPAFYSYNNTTTQPVNKNYWQSENIPLQHGKLYSHI